MKHYIIIILALIFLLPESKAQENTKRFRIAPYLKCGPAFLKYQQNRGWESSYDLYNRWAFEGGCYEKNSGLSLTVRYLSPFDGFMRNRMFKGIDRTNYILKPGDLIVRTAIFGDFSFLINKNIIVKKVDNHRLDAGLGIMRREGHYGYLIGWSAFEPRIDWQNNMSKTGILSRVSYSYLPHKNISLSLTTEYARYRNSPKDVLVISFLVGGHF